MMLGREVDPDEVGTLTIIPLDAPLDIEFRSREFEALCPAVAGVQPDVYDLTITFTASASIESKSLKLWLVTFRDERIFAEHLAARIGQRIVEALGEHLERMTVTLVQNIRGGIVETVTWRNA